MAEKNAISTQQETVALREKVWLVYFNSYLYDNGIITKTRQNCISMIIENCKSSTYSVKERISHGIPLDFSFSVVVLLK